MPDRRDHDRDWLFHALADIKDQMTGQHQRIRSDMSSGFDKVAAEVHRVKEQVNTVEERVLVIETVRKMEAEQSVRRSAWAGILAAAGLTATMKTIEAIWHWASR